MNIFNNCLIIIIYFLFTYNLTTAAQQDDENHRFEKHKNNTFSQSTEQPYDAIKENTDALSCGKWAQGYYVLGELYEEGWGSAKKDHNKATEYFILAAEQGHPLAIQKMKSANEEVTKIQITAQEEREPGKTHKESVENQPIETQDKITNDEKQRGAAEIRIQELEHDLENKNRELAHTQQEVADLSNKLAAAQKKIAEWDEIDALT